MGNSYSTPPRKFIRFNVAEVSGISRVQAASWVELQMAFGQMKRTDLSGATFDNDVMNFMAAAGGKFPVGTTFPNHAYLGIKDEAVDLGKTKGLRITEIGQGSPAERSGLKVGDVLTKISGKAFKSAGDLLDAAAKAAQTASYDVEFLRDGAPMKLAVERAFRPTWTEQVTPAVVASTSPPAPGLLSVADELTKLAKLKSDGLITDAEFEAQKKKLLER